MYREPEFSEISVLSMSKKAPILGAVRLRNVGTMVAVDVRRGNAAAIR
jgi:hypothetical protein